MALIYWMPSFNTEIDIIDQQHRLLVDLVNELSEAHEAGKDRQVLLKLIEKLGIYAATHFAREEDYFETYGYPNTDEHLQEHDYFEDMLYQFEDEFKAGKQDLTFNVLMFLSDWLVNHINGSDKEYVPFLQELVDKPTFQPKKRKYRGNTSTESVNGEPHSKKKSIKRFYRGKEIFEVEESAKEPSKKNRVYRGQS